MQLNKKRNITENMECPLCKSESRYFHQEEFVLCTNCRAIFRNQDYYVDYETEKERYEEHYNDVNDRRYQKFVSPITRHVTDIYSTGHLGLDYGSGTGPVISKMLRDKGYVIKQYDPIFADDKRVLGNQYDYIVCCEVIEHFHRPYIEFERLYNMLKLNGELICMTHLYRPEVDFKNWYYKNDVTHVFIYQPETIRYVAEKFGFFSYKIFNRLIVFKKGKE